MKVLVANLGSTSFKYRLIDVDSQVEVATGAIDRIGSPESSCQCQSERGQRQLQLSMPDHGVAVNWCLQQLTDSETGCLSSVEEIAAIGFKAVHGGRKSGVFRVDEALLTEMERMAEVAPAHNPPYVAAMRQLGQVCGDIPLVAAFETDFHRTIPEARRIYGLPKRWTQEFGVQRWGFHGASHRYIAQRSAELIEGENLKILSCHLGGSSSLCAIADRKSQGTTMGMSPQTGLPQNNRVGDFDPYALPLLMQETGLDLSGVLKALANEAGLLGISGVSGDMRDLRNAAQQGNQDAQLALDFFVSEVRRLMGGLIIELGQPDAVVFTGGIGQNDWQLRQAICHQLQWLGIQLDEEKNQVTNGEDRIDNGAGCQIWVIPTNEELVVAQQVKKLLESE